MENGLGFEINFSHLDVRNIPREGKIRGGSSDEDDDKLAQEEEEVNNTVKNHHPHQVPHDQIESFHGRFAEVSALNEDYKSLLLNNKTVHLDSAHDVGIPVDEPHELLQAPETTLAAADDALGEVVVVLPALPLHILQDSPDHPDDGDDEGAECDCSKMKD